MNWSLHKTELSQGKTVNFRPKGNSMQPKINSGELVTIEPIKDFKTIKKDDIVFCKVKGNHYVHLILAIQQKMGEIRFQIGNNKNRTNGWIGEKQIFGKVVKIEP